MPRHPSVRTGWKADVSACPVIRSGGVKSAVRRLQLALPIGDHHKSLNWLRKTANPVKRGEAWSDVV